MTETLLVSQILLWVVIIILAIVCTALARQVGVLYERIAPVGALSINKTLSAGDMVPQLRVQTLTGQLLNIGVPTKGGRSQLLFFLSPACPICKTLLPVLHRIRQLEESWLDIILVSDGDDANRHQAFVEQNNLGKYPYVLSEPLGLAYGIMKLPYAVLINENARVVALGLVNTREHLESLLEAKTLGVASIQDYLQNPVNSYHPGPNNEATRKTI